MLRILKMEDRRPMATLMVTNLKKVITSDSKLVHPMIYKHLIGSLMYLVNTRPDICFSMNTLSQFMVELKKVHWIPTKHVLRYLKGTMEYELRYLGGDGVEYQGYSESDWVGSEIDINITSGCYFVLGSTVITCFNNKHTFVALCSIEAEYMAVSMASCETIWL
jgi:hypothetical protein